MFIVFTHLFDKVQFIASPLSGSLTEHGILGLYKSTYVDSTGRTRVAIQ